MTTAFNAEQALTKDTVPVNVDSLNTASLLVLAGQRSPSQEVPSLETAA
jgi:hypothetical protein